MHTCNSKCNQWWNDSERDRCRLIRACACNVCSPLQAVNKQLFDSCVSACQTDPKPTSSSDYLCNEVGADSAFNNYGVLCGGIEDTAQYQVKELNNGNSYDERYVAFGAFLLILIFAYIVLNK